jgi:hypothetical protein
MAEYPREARTSVTAPQPATRFDILKMAARDLPAAQALSREVNWPHRLEDWQFVHAVGQGLVAYSGDQLRCGGLLTAGSSGSAW